MGSFFCCEKNHAFREKCAKLKSMQSYLRQGGRLILREVTSDNKLLLWFMDKIELPLANLCGHGDVKIATERSDRRLLQTGWTEGGKIQDTKRNAPALRGKESAVKCT